MQEIIKLDKNYQDIEEKRTPKFAKAKKVLKELRLKYKTQKRFKQCKR